MTLETTLTMPDYLEIARRTLGTMPLSRSGTDTSESEPVKARDPQGTPWAEWKAAALNRLFHDLGLTGQSGRITATTVRHGENYLKGTADPNLPLDLKKEARD